MMTRLKQLWQQRKPALTEDAVTRTVHVIRLPGRNFIRLEEWQQTPSLVLEAQNLLGSPTARAMIEVLRTESPANFGMPELGVSADDRAAYQARIEGYQLCLNNLEALAVSSKKKVPLEATFAFPETENLKSVETEL